MKDSPPILHAEFAGSWAILALAAGLARFEVADEVLTDNGKQFTDSAPAERC